MTAPPTPLLHVENLVKHFPVTAGLMGKTVAEVQAVSNVSFDVQHGETLGLVGESGCGKTTVGRCILRLLDPTAGRIQFEGRDITNLSMRKLRPLRRNMQIIFQDPYSSLNPRMTVRDAVGESLQVHRVARGKDINAQVAAMMERVGLPAQWMNRYPHEFSGGQRQRIGIARAIALNPKFIVCDEAVSALDVSVRAQVINLLIGLREEMNLAYLFIAHDLSVVRHISHRIAVMYLGHIMEMSPSRELFETPAHPYTLALLSAIPVPDPTRRSQRIRLAGDVPTPLNPPSGCRFHTRCPAAFERCAIEEPPLFDLKQGHGSKCWLVDELPGLPDWHARFMRRYEEHVQANLSKRGLSGGEAAREAAEDVELSEEVEASNATAIAQAHRQRLDRERSLRRPTGLILTFIGVAIALGTNVVAGATLVALAFLLLFFPFSRHKPALAVVLILILGASIYEGRRLESRRQIRVAKHQLSVLENAIGEYRKATKTLPESLRDVSWRLYETFPTGKVTDPWGRDWSYKSPDGKSYDLRSAGPDKKFRTADDVLP